MREERAATQLDQRLLTWSDPLYTLVAIGPALVVGSLVTLVIGNFSFTGRSQDYAIGPAAPSLTTGTARQAIFPVRAQASTSSAGSVPSP